MKSFKLTEYCSQFIFSPKEKESNHAASLVELSSGIFVTWFGGSKEGKNDVCIWGAHLKSLTWQKPFLIAKGFDAKGKANPCWNPVLTRQSDGQLTLFFKVGPSPREWWGMSCTSKDDGNTWSSAMPLPRGFLGPIKNKPLWVNDRLVCPSSTETRGREGWHIHFELYENGTFSKVPVEDPDNLQAIQPTILKHKNNMLQGLCRTHRKKVIATTFSHDGGNSWSPLQATTLPNSNSGIDATTLHNGQHLLVYNHTKKGRTPLNLALSKDGIEWSDLIVLENTPGEFSYPAVIQTSDDLIHLAYTWQRKSIRHRVFKID